MTPNAPRFRSFSRAGRRAWPACLAVLVLLNWGVIGCSRSTMGPVPEAHARLRPAPQRSAGLVQQHLTALSATTTAAASDAWTLRPGDEVWVITKEAFPSRTGDDTPLGLVGCIPGPGGRGPVYRPVPLLATEVTGVVAGRLSTVDVRQTYHNDAAWPLEAEYLFPLPEDAAVSDFLMETDGRRIRGVVRELGEARRFYAEARAQGHQASLLTQERPNLFRQALANLPPERDVHITLRYFSTLTPRDGRYAFVFPTAVGARYVPDGHVEPALAPSTSGDSLRWGAGNRTPTFDLELRVEPGVPLRQWDSPTHDVEATELLGGGAVFRLDQAVEPGRDFVLNYEAGGSEVTPYLLTHTDAAADLTYFSLTLYPPAEAAASPSRLSRLASDRRRPMEMVFVLDTSGSMRGRPLRKAKAAIREALERLTPVDTFQLISFSSGVEVMSRLPEPATRAAFKDAKRFLKRTSSGGGTELLQGLHAALDTPADPRRTRVVTFLTDGQIGNEADVFRTLHDRLHDAHVFVIGMGEHPNRYLLEGMASLGRGAAAYPVGNVKADDLMSTYLDRLDSTLLTQITIEAEDGTALEGLSPVRVPDLWAGRPVTVSGRIRGAAMPVLRVRGHLSDGRVASRSVTADRTDAPPALAKVWARQRLAALMQEGLLAPTRQQAEQAGDQAVDLALRYGLVSEQTAFLAVDAASPVRER